MKNIPRIESKTPNHYQTLQSWISDAGAQLLKFKLCLRCGRRFLRAGRAFTIPCVEGRIVRVEVCRACAKVSTVPATVRLGEGRVAA